MQYAITKGNRVVATAENKEESIALLGLMTHAVKREIVAKRKYHKREVCTVCGKKFHRMHMHMRKHNGFYEKGLIQQALGR